MMSLVSAGAFLDFRNRHSLTAMHIAADHGNQDAIRVSETSTHLLVICYLL